MIGANPFFSVACRVVDQKKKKLSNLIAFLDIDRNIRFKCRYNLY
jgi:hypothetical protein